MSLIPQLFGLGQFHHGQANMLGMEAVRNALQQSQFAAQLAEQRRRALTQENLQRQQIKQQKEAQEKAEKNAWLRMGIGTGAGVAAGAVTGGLAAAPVAGATMGAGAGGVGAEYLATQVPSAVTTAATPAAAAGAMGGAGGVGAEFLGRTAPAAMGAAAPGVSGPVAGGVIGGGLGSMAGGYQQPPMAGNYGMPQMPTYQQPQFQPFAGGNQGLGALYGGLLGGAGVLTGQNFLGGALQMPFANYNVARQGAMDTFNTGLAGANLGLDYAQLGQRAAELDDMHNYRQGQLLNYEDRTAAMANRPPRPLSPRDEAFLRLTPEQQTQAVMGGGGQAPTTQPSFTLGPGGVPVGARVPAGGDVAFAQQQMDKYGEGRKKPDTSTTEFERALEALQDPEIPPETRAALEAYVAKKTRDTTKTATTQPSSTMQIGPGGQFKGGYVKVPAGGDPNAAMAQFLASTQPAGGSQGVAAQQVDRSNPPANYDGTKMRMMDAASVDDAAKIAETAKKKGEISDEQYRHLLSLIGK